MPRVLALPSLGKWSINLLDLERLPEFPLQAAWRTDRMATAGFADLKRRLSVVRYEAMLRRKGVA